jgi:biopolymer transport protein ExbD
MGSAEMHHIRELGGVVNGMREVHGDEFMVVIKSPERTNPSVTVNVVEKMNALKVKRYTVSKLLPKEKTLLYSPTATKPPAPVEVKTPEAVKSRQIDSDNSFVIEIRKDETVWYQYRSPTARMAPQPVGEPVTPKLSSVIDDYNSNQPGLVYYIKGDKNATYPVFEKVVNALKANNIYKYILITDEN